MMEAREHFVQYLHGFPGVKEYRNSLVHVESPDDIYRILDQIQSEHRNLLAQKISQSQIETETISWNCAID